jgi:hypothetical protein
MLLEERIRILSDVEGIQPEEEILDETSGKDETSDNKI